MNDLCQKIALIVLLTILTCKVATAHEAGITDTLVSISRDSVKILYTVPGDHLSEIMSDWDSNDVQDTVENQVIDGFVVKSSDTHCDVRSSTSRSLEAIGSEQFEYLLDCGGPILQLKLEYHLLFDNDTSHQNLTRVSLLHNTQNVTFTNDNRVHSVDVEAFVRNLSKQRQAIPEQSFTAQIIDSAKRYFPIGAKHILLGFDHLLFLGVLLLLPLRFRNFVVLITTFTIAHSVTLVMSALNVISLPPAIVESAIAFSIIYMAIETVILLRGKTAGSIDTGAINSRIGITGLFGLLHGFGFSYVLKELDLGDQLITSLLFFNLGVEAGQLLIMFLVLPILMLLFKRFPSGYWAQAMAVAIGAVGLFWFAERLPGLF